ncbi:MAG: helix-turn-helix domain-containing protein, partial [Clostridia bacterium]|nr:helix-turn-helix domain-containing protein [Clostridia bacterium]
SKEEFYKLCHISKKTAYKLIKSGRIKANKRNCASRHCYEIPISEIERLESIRRYINKLREEEIGKTRDYYSEKLKKYPDVITSEDVQAITGYVKETVRRWIQSGKLVAIVYKSKYVIAQNDFLNFVTSSHFVGITRKSREHLSDFIKLGIVDKGGQRL